MSVDKERIEELVDDLPTYVPKDEESPNYKIFGPIAEQIEKHEQGLEDLEKDSLVPSARSIEGLRKLAKLVGTLPERNESLEHYRVRVITSFQNVTNEGSINELIENFAFILGINKERIAYLNSDEPGLVVLGIPQTAIDDSVLTQEDIADILTDNVAAGREVSSVATGTFTYITPEEYNNGNMNPDYGYTTLDENGDPIDEGGTYSTTMN